MFNAHIYFLVYKPYQTERGKKTKENEREKKKNKIKVRWEYEPTKTLFTLML